VERVVGCFLSSIFTVIMCSWVLDLNTSFFPQSVDFEQQRGTLTIPHALAFCIFISTVSYTPFTPQVWSLPFDSASSFKVPVLGQKKRTDLKTCVFQ